MVDSRDRLFNNFGTPLKSGQGQTAAKMDAAWKEVWDTAKVRVPANLSEMEA
jgi:hypothetical protein